MITRRCLAAVQHCAHDILDILQSIGINLFLFCLNCGVQGRWLMSTEFLNFFPKIYVTTSHIGLEMQITPVQISLIFALISQKQQTDSFNVMSHPIYLKIEILHLFV